MAIGTSDMTGGFLANRRLCTNFNEQHTAAGRGRQSMPWRGSKSWCRWWGGGVQGLAGGASGGGGGGGEAAGWGICIMSAIGLQMKFVHLASIWPLAGCHISEEDKVPLL